jgi:hypothetical protein
MRGAMEVGQDVVHEAFFSESLRGSLWHRGDRGTGESGFLGGSLFSGSLLLQHFRAEVAELHVSREIIDKTEMDTAGGRKWIEIFRAAADS